jgi:hypothetical protein
MSHRVKNSLTSVCLALATVLFSLIKSKTSGRLGYAAKMMIGSESPIILSISTKFPWIASSVPGTDRLPSDLLSSAK